MRISTWMWLAVLGGAAGMMGCIDASQPLPRTPVASSRNPDAIPDDVPIKPLPPQDNGPAVGKPFYDPPLIVDMPPEVSKFVDVYNRVGRPRIVVFVNRTLTGDVVPVNPVDPDVRYEYTKRTSDESWGEKRTRSDSGSRWNRDMREDVDRYETRTSTEVRDFRPPDVDEAGAKSIDYELMESLLTDWLSANGQVETISPTMSRKPLTAEQAKDLQSGRKQALAELAQQLDADILIQIQAKPTRQTRDGLSVLAIGEAVNLRGGQAIAHVAVEVPPPLDKVQLNKFTRFMARKMMFQMTQAWRSMPAPPATQP